MRLLDGVVLYGLFVAAAASSDYFKSPARYHGENPVWTLGDQHVISWETSLDVFNLSIWQQSLVEDGASSQGNIYGKIHAGDQVTNFTWVVQPYGFDLDYSNVFFLWINPDGPNGFTSTYFNVSKPSSTSSASTATSTSTETSSPSTDTKSTSSPSSDSSQDSPDSTSSPIGTQHPAQIALGVGVGVGVPILCALGVLIWLKLRKQKAQTQETVSAPVNTMPPWPAEMQQPPRRPLSGPKEVHGNALPGYSELPGHTYR